MLSQVLGHEALQNGAAAVLRGDEVSGVDPRTDSGLTELNYTLYPGALSVCVCVCVCVCVVLKH